MSRLRELRWLAVPVAAYIAITIGLPAANGAVQRAEFVRHLVLVVLGCAAVAAVVLAIALVAPKGDRS
ncbi:MAG TPA: hypothetical protein VMJ10_19125 [Kofleriaceae bacterium]|nr:hypothetical protein [Kofleriaceae bacterium]